MLDDRTRESSTRSPRVRFAIGDYDINNGVVQLRAERAGTGAGRTYTLTARAIDLAGNTGEATATCTVPHDRRR